MKNSFSTVTYKSIVTALMLIIFQTITWAQESAAAEGGSTTTTTTKSTHTQSITSEAFYTQPWVWVAGAAVFILLLIALLRGNSSNTVSRTEKVTVAKTTDREV
jgi:hypothetical protein